MGVPGRIPTLKDLCCHAIVRTSSSLEKSICDLTPQDLYVMKRHVCLPAELCESLIEAYTEEGHVLDDKFIHAFKDKHRTCLTRANLRNSRVTDSSLQWLCHYRLRTLDISGCVEPLTDCLTSLDRVAPYLESLCLGDRSNVIFDEPRVRRGIQGSDANGNNGSGPNAAVCRSMPGTPDTEADTMAFDGQLASPDKVESAVSTIPFVEEVNFVDDAAQEDYAMESELELTGSDNECDEERHMFDAADGIQMPDADLRAMSRLSDHAFPIEGSADIEYADAACTSTSPDSGNRMTLRSEELGSASLHSASSSSSSSSSNSGADSQGNGVFCRDFVLRGAKRLRELTAHQLQPPLAVPVLRALVRPCSKRLVHLDLSSSSIPAVSLADCLVEMPQLITLVLHGVVQVGELRALADALVSGCKRLRYLDISHAKAQPVDFGRADEDLYYLVTGLPELVSLDLSGTNLPGNEPLKVRSTAPPVRRQHSATAWRPVPYGRLARSISSGSPRRANAEAPGDELPAGMYCSEDEDDESNLDVPIPALRDFSWPGSKYASICYPCRTGVTNLSALAAVPDLRCRRPRKWRPPLEFLGLLGCANDACFRERLPAHRVTGDANESQIVESLRAYASRPEAAVECLNNLFSYLREQRDVTFSQRFVALKLLCAVMRENPDKANVQISGSASMFYLVKSSNVNKHLPPHELRHVVRTLFEGMQRHEREKTMLRNGLLTLCHFAVPEDVMFIYEDLVRLLLSVIEDSDPRTDEFIQRISIYILNSLVCRVDNNDKLLVGEKGAVKVMLKLIKEKLQLREGDEVLEFAWSTLWNITDEAASNCNRFMVGEDEAEGMTLFTQCYEMFPNREALLRNMMGLLGNVAEVAYLRPSLLQERYITLFSALLDCSMDGIEVSYNAAGVLSHILSDGAEVWTISRPARTEVLEQLQKAIDRWDLNARRSINYRSFGPILRIVQCYHTPQAQHWAVWALCNLTNVYAPKYCSLLIAEGGTELLTQLLADPRPYTGIKMLVEQIMRRLDDYRSGRLPDVPEGGEFAV